MCNIAVISVHTSPLALPGTRDSGGLNVYVRELSREMAQRGHRMDIFTRRTDAATPEITIIDESTRVIQIEAGPLDADKAAQRRHLETFRKGVMAFAERARRASTMTWCTATTGCPAGSARRSASAGTPRTS